MPTSPRPTIVFATMCKNEEHCIRATLESIADHIDYWVVCDTGSTDRTCEIVREFFAERGIPGELFVDAWVGFGPNKTLMMGRAHAKADYILHLDADDILVGPLGLTPTDLGKDAYVVPLRRGNLEWKATILYAGQIRWKFCGVAHTTIRPVDRPTFSTGDLSKHGCWVNAEGIGSRAFDPKKFLHDAERLTQQFWDTLVSDPDDLNARSVFYTAQSYMDYGKPREAMQWYRLYLKLKDTWIEEVFEAQLRIARCMTQRDYPVEAIIAEFNKASAIFPDRAEPSHHLGRFLNSVQRHEEAYTVLKHAQRCDFARVQQKYILFLTAQCYGTHVNDELAVACYWTNRIEEGLQLVDVIVDDPAFAPHRERIVANQQHLRSKPSAPARWNFAAIDAKREDRD